MHFCEFYGLKFLCCFYLFIYFYHQLLNSDFSFRFFKLKVNKKLYTELYGKAKKNNNNCPKFVKFYLKNLSLKVWQTVVIWVFLWTKLLLHHLNKNQQWEVNFLSEMMLNRTCIVYTFWNKCIKWWNTKPDCLHLFILLHQKMHERSSS